MNDKNTTNIEEMMENPVKVDHLDENTEYVARLEFRSTGDSAEVRPTFKFTHEFDDDYDGEWPSSYLAMRDMSQVLNMMLHTEGSGMVAGPNVEHEFISIDDLEDLEDFQSGSQTKN